MQILEVSGAMAALWTRVALLCCCCFSGAQASVNLYALFNMDGIHGTINFVQETESNNVSIVVNLESFKEPGNYSWYIATNLLSYSEKNPCSKKNFGNRVDDLTARHGQLSVPTAGDVTFTDGSFTLHGPTTIWEKSVVLEGGGSTVCANILSLDAVNFAEARFTSYVAGSIQFRQIFPDSPTIPSTIITANLFHVGSDAPTSSNHDWKILVTDVLDTRSERRVGTCDHLTLLYDPDNVDDTACSGADHRACKKGDLTRKHGKITIGAKQSRYTRKVIFDSNLPFPDLDGSRFLYVAVYSADSPNTILSCAKISQVPSKESQVRFSSDGVQGFISFRQQSALDPTHVTVNLTGLNGTGVFYHVHLFPAPPRLGRDDPVCAAASDHFNPLGVDRVLSPAPGNATYERYEAGDLSGKYGLLSGDAVVADFIDPYLTLYGIHSIVGRSVVVHRADSSRWMCANVEYPRPVATAVAAFRYPFAGRVIFRQDAEDPAGDTTVFVESLVFVDGAQNFSAEHQWHVHGQPVSNDSLDWQKRCLSAGPGFNPFRVSTGKNGYRDCGAANPLRCIVGDLTKKVGRINVAAHLADIGRTRLFYTDTNIPVTGQSSIIGRSLVVQDDHAPDFRGDRMACATIRRRYPSRARVNQWYRSGDPSNVTGHVIMEQYTEYDITITEVELSGMKNLASGYHVHEVPVPVEYHFPCTNDAVYGHYNPFGINPKTSPPPATGSNDQYELGDLSGKYGPLDNENSYYLQTVDSNLPVQGPYSVLGRSVVVHKKDRGERWTCGNVEPYVKENGRRIQAIASFHHPKTFAYGYIKLGQVEYVDGSLSDTTIEVNVRYPGYNNKNVTRGHKWAVFQGYVGEDMTVKAQIARCLGAGFRYNPFRVKSDREDYGKECSARTPLACDLGDLSGRHGTVIVGGPRTIFTDPNLPLTGNYTVMKKSIVIFERDGDTLARLACANILPDNDITQKVQIKKMNRITDQGFIDKAREAMAVPEWMMHIVAGETKDLGECIQITMYFRGPDANRLQLDFDKLLNTGRVDRGYAVALGDTVKNRGKFPFEACNTILDTFLGKNGKLALHSFPALVMILTTLTTALKFLNL